MCAQEQDAQDLLQDTLVAALTHIDTLKDDGAFRGWLLAILRNRATSNHRRRLLNRLLPAGLAFRAPAGSNASAALAAGANEAGTALSAALGQLSAPYRNLLLMHYADELTAVEIAAALGLSVAAVEQRLLRARRALKQLLGSELALCRPGLLPGGLEK